MPNRKISLSLLLLTTALCVLVQTTLRAQSTTKAAPTGSISGKVTIKDKGVPDISVVAQLSERSPFQQISIRARTDASGQYRLTGLGAGQYQIIALAPGMAAADTPSATTYFGSSKSVVLAAGEDVDDIDIKLVHGSVITGRVTDGDDKPVIEQRVNLELLDSSGNPTRQVETYLNYQMSVTDDRGIYRIYGLPAGRYRASVGSNEIVMGSNRTFYPLSFYGGTNDPAKAIIIDLQEGSEAANIDIHVGRGANTFMATGRLIDKENGQPIPGVRIMYGPARQNEQFYGGFIGLPTGARGEFRLEGLAPGRYGITVSAMFSDNAPFYSDPTYFEITDSDLTNLELKASRGQTLSGVVICEGSRAQELMRKISSVRINANVSSATPNARSSSSASAPIAADGSFQVGGVRSGRVNLFIGAFTDSPLRNMTILRIERGGVDVTQGFDIQPGESISDLRVFATVGTGTIRGTVRVVGGQLPANSRVELSARREGARPPYGWGMPDTRGRFVMTNLVAGTYEVMLLVNISGQRSTQPQKQTVTVLDDGEVQVDFIIDLTQKEGGP